MGLVSKVGVCVSFKFAVAEGPRCGRGNRERLGFDQLQPSVGVEINSKDPNKRVLPE